jgi:hypothetical protein
MIDTPLREIARSKGTDKEGAHAYADAYERHLGHLRSLPITLLEIGIGGYANPDKGGASLRMWKEYFPLGRIIGLDIEDKSQFAEDRITILQGDQSDRPMLDRIARDHGPFDVVIDDGSHQNAHVIASFEALFPHLKDDGIYVIEDLQTAYWGRYGGSSGADRSGTSMTMLQALADGLNYAELDIPYYEPSYTDLWVRSLTFHHNIAFIQKGPNTDRSNMLPPHPRPKVRFGGRPKPAAQVGGQDRRASLISPRRLARRLLPLGFRRAVVALGRSIGLTGRGSKPRL